MQLSSLTRFAALLFTCLVSSFAYAAPVDVTALQHLADNYVTAHRNDEYVSALSLSVWMPDAKAPITVHAGSAAYDAFIPLTNDSQYQIGSITKSYITAIILQLEGEGRYHFSIDDPLEKFLPDYTKWQGVTIRQLMNMTSGIPSYSNDENFANTFLNNPYRDMSPTELVGFVAQQSLLFKPGTQWDYSNTNYLLLGMIIEKLTSHPLVDEINQRLISKLHLTHTIYAPFKPTPDLLMQMVHGYSYRRTDDSSGLPLGQDVTNFSLSWAGAAGAIDSNAEDVAKWVKALYTPGVVLNPVQWAKLTQIVSIRTGQPMTHLTEEDPAAFGMGIGYGYFPGIGKAVYTYEGMTFASRGFYIEDPATGIVIAGTLNSSLEVKDDHYTALLADVYQLVTQDHGSV